MNASQFLKKTRVFVGPTTSTGQRSKRMMQPMVGNETNRILGLLGLETDEMKGLKRGSNDG
jgi:hypothetical protein